MEGVYYAEYENEESLRNKQSGASGWTSAQRQTFANDLTHPQLLVVTDNVNESKGDKGPEDWKPYLGGISFAIALHTKTDIWTDSYHCTYAEMWVKVKTVYNLTITSDEKTALVDMLETC